MSASSPCDTKSSYFEQYKSNHYKWCKDTQKYQNDEYLYLTPPFIVNNY